MAKPTDETKKDHPDQAIDTDLPGNSVNKDAFKALQEQYEGDPNNG